MKENSRRELLREADGWLVTHPDRVRAVKTCHLTFLLYNLHIYCTFVKVPSCIRVDRLEWPTGDDMVCIYSFVFDQSMNEYNCSLHHLAVGPSQHYTFFIGIQRKSARKMVSLQASSYNLYKPSTCILVNNYDKM